MSLPSHSLHLPAVIVDRVSYWYRDRQALADLSLEVMPGSIFALVGPNGSGKSTLFRLLATLVPLQQGEIRCLGYSVRHQADVVRWLLAVVFQSPSVDRKLTVWENMLQQMALYGLPRRAVTGRAIELLQQLGLADRRHSLVETLSGGLRRRLELAKALIPRPQLLIMDEPSTGLDPAARMEWWNCLQHIRREQGTTIVFTTHLLDEADRADVVAIVDAGRLVAMGSPSQLRAEIGGEVLTVETDDPQQFCERVHQQWNVQAQVVGRSVRWQVAHGHQWMVKLMETCGDRISCVSVGKPTLEDVFVAKTGHRFDEPREG